MSASNFFAVMTVTFLFSLPSAAQVTVTDDFNRQVTLPSPATRILSLGPHITENLFSAGAGDKIVGVVDHSDYPPAAQAIESIGSYANINLESVIALSPDLVVAWQTAGNRATLKKIAALGYPVYYSEPRAFDDIIENIEEFAMLADTDAQIAPAALRAELAAVRATYRARETQSVFYQVWGAPLITLNGEHIVSRVLEVCGARNVFADLPIIAPRVGVEAVLDANPDIIITGGDGDDLVRWKKWSALSATVRDGFLSVDSDVMHRHTARMLMGIRGLCEGIDRVRRG